MLHWLNRFLMFLVLVSLITIGGGALYFERMIRHVQPRSVDVTIDISRHLENPQP